MSWNLSQILPWSSTRVALIWHVPSGLLLRGLSSFICKLAGAPEKLVSQRITSKWLYHVQYPSTQLAASLCLLASAWWGLGAFPQYQFACLPRQPHLDWSQLLVTVHTGSLLHKQNLNCSSAVPCIHWKWFVRKLVTWVQSYLGRSFGETWLANLSFKQRATVNCLQHWKWGGSFASNWFGGAKQS